MEIPQQAFSKFFEQAMQKEVTITCENKEQANKLRSDLYRYKTRMIENFPHSSEGYHNVEIHVQDNLLIGSPILY